MDESTVVFLWRIIILNVSREGLNDTNFKSKVISKLVVLLDCEAIHKLHCLGERYKYLEPTSTANKRLVHMKVVFCYFHLNGHTQVLYKKTQS